MKQTSRDIGRRGWACAVAVVITATLAAGVAHAQDRLVIGVGGPFTGQFELFGTSIRTGVDAAIDDINDAGGVLGQPLALSIADDACNADRAEAAANQLVGANAVLVVGHVCYSATREAAAVYALNDIVQITPASQSDGLTTNRPGPGLFRLAPRAERQGEVAGAFLADRHPTGNIAILHDGTAYGKGLADTVKAVVNAAGIQEVWFDEYDAGDESQIDLAIRLLDDAIDAVYLGGYHTDIAQIAAETRGLDLKTVIIGPDSIADSEFRAIAGPAAIGVFLTFQSPLPETDASRSLAARLKLPKSIGTQYTLLAYAAVELWAAAAARAESIAFDAVIDAVASNPTDTIIGTVRFDDNGSWQTDGFSVFEWGEDGIQPVAAAPATD